MADSSSRRGKSSRPTYNIHHSRSSQIGLEVKTKPTEEVTEVVEIVEDEDPEEAISKELERLNAEAATRTKRARRRANELRTRTIQRMQLQMTAPLDIGMDQTDASLLTGQEDIFDLDYASKSLRQKGGVVGTLGDEEYDESDEERAGDAAGDEDEEVLDDVEEQEKRMEMLEAELDGLYDQYQTRLSERDAKYRVREARRKDKSRETWGGIRKADSDSDDDDDEEEDKSDEEGGWDKVEAAKARAGEDSSDDDESDEEEPARETEAKKRRRAGEGGPPERKKMKLARVDDTVAKPALSKAAQIWFSQDHFAGVALNDISDDEAEAEEEEEDAGEEGDEDEDMADAEPISDSDLEDDFEEVPADPEDHGEMWDVDDEDSNEVMQEKIRRKFPPSSLISE